MHGGLMMDGFNWCVQVWAEQALYAMIIGNLASTLVAGPAAAVMLRKEKEAYAMRHQALESLREEEELRMITCAHSAHSMPALLSLVELMVMEADTQPAVHVLHLFEGSQKRAAAAAAAASPTALYNPHIIDEYDAGREAINDMNTVVDLYWRSTGVAFQQIDVVGSSASRDVDAVCRHAGDAHAALLLLPCYREQRYDGKMACRLEERRELNVGVLAKAPCTVGLLMDRPYRSNGASFQVPSSVDTSTSTLLHPCSDRAVRHVIAAVFLGGADDREAVSVASRLAENPNIGLTVFRFVKLSTYDTVTSSTSRASAVAAGEGLSRPFNDAEVDERFMWRFYENYAAREMAMYVEKVVESPADVVETLDAMAGMFSLVIVGRGGRQPKELLAGLDRWAEAGRELGAVAEILASNTSMEMGSVLIMQQHRVFMQVPR
ncbi:cation/H(+) antiporter 15-like [Hordeum vulgare]|nr:cation/H(+) antiporter 15-like [Hordeum vulgare]